ncbi:MAG TPA: hypothetical protein PLF38_06205, partial [Xylanibacter oryzae]|nr:hypothetical protein [Xylanibacter oryzae]
MLKVNSTQIKAAASLVLNVNVLTTMAKIKILILLLLSTITMSAQKHFTLEDLNFGGNNFHNMRPENRFSTW